MSIEASVIRIEAQNAVIAEVLVGVFEVQKQHTDMLKTLSAAAPQAIDTTALDASIADTDARLATLTQPSAVAAPAAATAAEPAPQPAAQSGDAAATAAA